MLVLASFGTIVSGSDSLTITIEPRAGPLGLAAGWPAATGLAAGLVAASAGLAAAASAGLAAASAGLAAAAVAAGWGAGAQALSKPLTTRAVSPSRNGAPN